VRIRLLASGITGRTTLNYRRFPIRPAFVVTLAALFLLTACAGPLQLRQKTPLTLVWYGLARQAAVQHPTYVPLEDGVELATGDGVQLFLTVEPDAFVYILHQTATGDFALFWPTEEAKFNAHMESGRVQTLPSRGRVYTLDFARGVEALYVIASREPIDSVEQLTWEMRALFAVAQAIAVEVPPERIRESMPPKMAWELNLKQPVPIALVDQHIPVGASVRSIGEWRRGSEQIVTTVEGGHYSVRAERLTGDKVVARVVRLNRVISHGDGK
jgi:hypothetical protein